MEHGICTDEDDLFDELALGFFLPGTEAPAEQLGRSGRTNDMGSRCGGPRVTSHPEAALP